MRPDTLGPSAGATAMTIEMRPTMRPRICGGTSPNTVVNSSGIMMAVPLACTMREMSSISKPGESAPRSVPRLNRLIATMNMGRVWKRCSRKPVIGMMTARVSMKAVVSHCAIAAVTPRSSMSSGIATPNSVSLRITTKAETSRSEMTRLCRASIVGRPAGEVRAAGAAGVEVTATSTYEFAAVFPPEL